MRITMMCVKLSIYIYIRVWRNKNSRGVSRKKEGESKNHIFRGKKWKMGNQKEKKTPITTQLIFKWPRQFRLLLSFLSLFYM